MKKTTLTASILLAAMATSAQAANLINGLGGPNGFGENNLVRNDDGSSSQIDISSVFTNGLNFFGTTYNSFYVNNNGNITFNDPQGSYTPTFITANTSNPMLAAFFADVDTRGGDVAPSAGGTSTGANLTYYDLDAVNGIFTATWDDVGYYRNATNKLNAFQIIITDQSDNYGAGDFDIEFRYENIEWTTGRASGGTNGLGGTVARAGWTSGNGTDYFELAASGDQSLMLNLINSSNVNEAGVYRFGVRNGNVVVVPPSTVPVPAAVILFGPALLGFLGLRRKAKTA